jgi:GR25 family glycosyltransferase involved in LPS biosynthesis
MFETYIINLKKDINKFYKLKKELNIRGIQSNRFNAIYGKDIININNYSKYLTNFCKIFCPKSVIGCGLSHYILLEKIYLAHKQNRISNYSLILEDDAIPLFNSKNDIEKIIEKIPNDCDILSLFCQGICKYKQQKQPMPGESFMGSAAAYLVKNDSIPKINKYKLINHIDVQRYNTKDIKIYVYNPKLFNVDNSSSYNLVVNKNTNKNVLNKFISNKLNIENISIYELFSYKIMRIPILNYEITAMSIIKFLCLICIFIFLKKKYN